ncbi:MAG: hypothetical protein KF807_01760 [Xanthobacteraceae bacterium]|nr:hypothetical protein [Xanthobacteraceae bacterium]
MTDEANARFMRRLTRQDGILSQISAHIIHEGRATAIVRQDLSVDKTEMVSNEASTELSFSEIENITADAIIAKLVEMARQFREQATTHLLNTMNKVTSETGQVYDAKGKPLTNEAIFEMLEMMPIDFEKNKNVGDLVVLTAPAMMPVFQKLEEEMKANPELRKKHQAILEKKRDEYRTREINRNLVG